MRVAERSRSDRVVIQNEATIFSLPNTHYRHPKSNLFDFIVRQELLIS